MTGEEMNLTDEERVLWARTIDKIMLHTWEVEPLLRTISTLRTQLATVTRERDEAREGLKPFAEAVGGFPAGAGDNTVVMPWAANATLGDLRRAAAILKEGE